MLHLLSKNSITELESFYLKKLLKHLTELRLRHPKLYSLRNAWKVENEWTPIPGLAKKFLNKPASLKGILPCMLLRKLF